MPVPRCRVVPVLRVSTSLESLHDGLHRAGITDSGEHLGAATLRRLACDAEIIPTVLNSKGRVIDVGRRTRVVGEGLRCVLIARDGCCVWPGCDASPSRCDAHHVKHWAHGGPTNADNLALLCHRHHTLLHEGRHRLERLDDAWTVLKPDGTPLHPPPASATDNTDTADSTIAGATGVCSAGPVAASGQRTQAVVVPDPGGRAANSAATERPKQLTLACHGYGEVTIPLPRTDDSSEITRTALRADSLSSRRPPNRRRAASAQHTPDAQAIDTVSSSNPQPAAPAQHQQGRGSRENPPPHPTSPTTARWCRRVQRPPTSIDVTSVNTSRPAPVEPPKRTVSSIRASNPSVCIAVPASNNPASSILPRQEAFLVDTPHPNTSPRRWIQAKSVRG